MSKNLLINRSKQIGYQLWRDVLGTVGFPFIFIICVDLLDICFLDANYVAFDAMWHLIRYSELKYFHSCFSLSSFKELKFFHKLTACHLALLHIINVSVGNCECLQLFMIKSIHQP